MDKADTARLIGIIVMAYPNFDRFRSPEQVETMITVWSEMFAEDNGALVGAAVKKHIATNKFPPSIAEIREIMCDLLRPDILPPDKAWALVADMIASGAWDLDLYTNMPPLTARAVEIIGWSHLKELSRGHFGNYRDGADRLAFMDVYKPMYERERQTAMLPESLRDTFKRAELKYGAEVTAMLTDAYEKRSVEENKWSRYAKNMIEFLGDGNDE